ncbi:MAG: RlmE family RNA methyltransferase [Treponema sp.]|jgi:23S rRNA (uridine2552-2'-O)-methyltransferase|nr:RlmE family RNA methyltransferase [Treponema sp.]
MTRYEKPDYWSVKAKQEGYPARSVYKLQAMDEKFGLFSGHPKPGKVLDLGAAPGSWSLYALKRLGAGGFILGVDRSSLARDYDGGLLSGDRYCFLQGDLTSREIQEAILVQGPFHLVMSDAAPGTTGHPSVDALRSLVLAEAALEYADLALFKGGNLVVKVFQGGESPNLLKRIRERFKTAKSFKPAACRGTSCETYYVGLDKKSTNWADAG